MTATQATVPPLTTRPTFHDPDLQEAFSRDGFVVLPLFSEPEVRAARELYASLGDPPGEGFQTDFERDDPARKRHIHDVMASVSAPAIGRVLQGYRPFMTTFLAKWPGTGSELYVHQDWSYVDERVCRSVVVWIALEDTSQELDNGPIEVVPGSHRIAGEYRGTRTSPWYADHPATVAAALEPVDVPAGHAVVMDNALVHASPENRSMHARRSASAWSTTRCRPPNWMRRRHG